MHNRLAFYTDEIPYANMDGYERLIAFKTSDRVDMAIGQVESWRLRGGIAETGNEGWHVEWPLHRFEDDQLRYRRTLLLLKGDPDILVIRDQYEAPEAVHAAFPLFVKDNATVTEGIKGTAVAAKGSTLIDKDTDFARKGVQPGWCVTVNPDMSRWGAKNIYEIVKVSGNSLELNKPIDAGDATTLSYMVMPRRYEIEGRAVHFESVSLFRAHPENVTTRFFPYFHFNGGLEATQGIRLELPEASASGEYITALVPRPHMKADDMEAIPGGIRIGDTRVVFAGGIDDDDAVTYATVSKGDKTVAALTGKDIDMDRSQGEIGIFVPDAGYPFGEIPDWLIRQRLAVPAWAPEWAKQIRSRKQ